MATEGNVSEERRWNGETAHRWITHRERHADVRRRLTPHLLRAAAVSPGDRVLDVGCGCGETTIAVARLAGPDGGVVGLDLSGPMLEVARQLAAAEDLGNIDFVRADAQVHPLPAASYDVVMSSFGVMFFDDPVVAFGNLRSAMRPGGRLAFLCWQNHRSNEVFSIPERAVTAHTRLAGVSPTDRFADPARVTGILARAGFTDTRVEALHEPARIGSDVADVVEYVRNTSRFCELVADVDDEILTRHVLPTMAREFAARQQPDGVWVEAGAWLVTASNG